MSRCTATAKRTGEQCRRAALSGANVCLLHGASAPQVRRAAARRVAREQAVDLARIMDAPDVTDPAEALLQLASQAMGLVDALRLATSELESISETGWNGARQTAPTLDAYLSALQRAESIVGRINALGLAERRVALDEARLQLMADVMLAVVRHPDLALSPERQDRARELLAIEANARERES